MKIVIVIDLIDLRTNGSVMTALRFADGLKARGHEVKIVAIGSEDCPLEERYLPVVTPVSAKNQIKFGKFDKEKIKKTFEGADIVHCIFPFMLEKKCKFLADEMGIPVTTAFHVQPENFSYNMGLGQSTFISNIIYAFFRNKYYKHFTRIHCPSACIARQLEKHNYKGEIYVISNGYDKDFVPPAVKRQNDKFEIVMVGRLAPEKNQKVLISAIGMCRYRDKIRLTLLGNGPKKKKLQKQAEKLNVNLAFDFMNKQQLIEKLQQSDLYVHSSKCETEAIACLEAIACGLVPVVADSPLSATPQFTLDKRSLFKNDNAVSLAQQIEYWYEHPEEREKMGKLYAQSAKKYSLDNSVLLAERMFADQIADSKSAPSYTEVPKKAKATNKI